MILDRGELPGLTDESRRLAFGALSHPEGSKARVPIFESGVSPLELASDLVAEFGRDGLTAYAEDGEVVFRYDVGIPSFDLSTEVDRDEAPDMHVGEVRGRIGDEGLLYVALEDHDPDVDARLPAAAQWYTRASVQAVGAPADSSHAMVVTGIFQGIQARPKGTDPLLPPDPRGVLASTETRMWEYGWNRRLDRPDVIQRTQAAYGSPVSSYNQNQASILPRAGAKTTESVRAALAKISRQEVSGELFTRVSAVDQFGRQAVVSSTASDSALFVSKAIFDTHTGETLKMISSSVGLWPNPRQEADYAATTGYSVYTYTQDDQLRRLTQREEWHQSFPGNLPSEYIHVVDTIYNTVPIQLTTGEVVKVPVYRATYQTFHDSIAPENAAFDVQDISFDFSHDVLQPLVVNRDMLGRSPGQKVTDSEDATKLADNQEFIREYDPDTGAGVILLRLRVVTDATGRHCEYVSSSLKTQ